MNRRLITTLLVACGLISLTLAGVASTPRSIDLMQVQQIDRTGRAPAAEPAPLVLNGYEVLLLLDSGRSASTTLMRLLARPEYDGRGLVIVLLGDPNAGSLTDAAAGGLPQARWVRAEIASVLGSLDLAGTPVLLGVDPDGVIRWQRAGVPERVETWLDAILDWTGRERPDSAAE